MKKFPLPTRESLLFSRAEAAELIHLLARFDSSVLLCGENRTINAKSLLGLLSLWQHGESLTLQIEGADEERVLSALTDFFAARFDGERG